MCGLWGFNNSYNSKININIAKDIILKADERGGHSFGIYGIKHNNDELIFKSNGRVDNNIDSILDLIRNCKYVIGHSRLATSGDISLFNSQPIFTRDGAIVHNGNVIDYKQIYSQFNYTPITDNDSEAMILKLKNELDITDPHAFLFIKKYEYVSELLVNNNGLPLFKKTHNNIDYFCSKNFEIK